MQYTIPAKETVYAGVVFRSRLEARWAAFFDLCRWKWEYEPCDLPGWSPDFFVEFPCGHSECNPTHAIYAEVKPYRSLNQFRNHPSMRWSGFGQCECHYCNRGDAIVSTPGHDLDVDTAAQLGQSPDITELQMAHGSGGGCFSLRFFVPGDGCWPDQYERSVSAKLWKEAGNLVMWRYQSNGKRTQ